MIALRVWTIGLLGGILFFLLKMTKRVEIRGLRGEKLKPEGAGLVLIPNHPSLWEPIVLPFLFFPHFLFFFKFFPISTPDKENYYGKWWFWPVRKFCIPIERGRPRQELGIIENSLKPLLRENRILILFPEGGRTFKGKIKRGVRRSQSGQEIAALPLGMRKLFYGADFKILPVWVEGADKVVPNNPLRKNIFAKIPRVWKKTRITVGEPFYTKDIPKEKVVSYLEQVMLDLAEKEGSNK